MIANINEERTLLGIGIDMVVEKIKDYFRDIDTFEIAKTIDYNFESPDKVEVYMIRYKVGSDSDVLDNFEKYVRFSDIRRATEVLLKKAIIEVLDGFEEDIEIYQKVERVTISFNPQTIFQDTTIEDIFMKVPIMDTKVSFFDVNDFCVNSANINPGSHLWDLAVQIIKGEDSIKPTHYCTNCGSPCAIRLCEGCENLIPKTCPFGVREGCVNWITSEEYDELEENDDDLMEDE